MSYSIYLFRKEVKDKQLQSTDEDFFESETNLVPFSKDQKDYLKNRLLKYKYILWRETSDGYIHFDFADDDSISVLLTNCGLYFWSTGEGIFEISMTASEFTDTGEFLKFDPQDGGWEEL